MTSEHERHFSIPESLLDSLLTSEAVASAHLELCIAAPITKYNAPHHPGDPIGKAIAWLWSIGDHNRCAQLAADYLVEMRRFNPNSKEGERLTLDDLVYGLACAASIQLDCDETTELSNFLKDSIPRFYGQAPKRLNVP